jgi:ribosomal 50S subunit-associated protein YjgA (DUF615 family)
MPPANLFVDYDQKGKLIEDHVDLKKLRVRLATLRDACLAKLPPCDDVESHLVMACAAGKMLHKTGLRMLQIECTGMNTPILGVCDQG